jgi:hypothetical protein
MSRNFGLLARRAQFERERTINPRHEELPHGDWPHLDLKPLEELDHDAANGIVRLFGIAVAVAALMFAVVIVVWLASMLISWPAHAHDPTGYWAKQIAEGKAPPAEWWNGLASGKGLCCSFADGVRVEDVDWDTGGPSGEYRVRLHSAWFVVPETALVKEPNKFGPAVVWPYTDVGGNTQIRCFLPGAGA